MKERDYPFVECASLADDIKYRGGGWQSDWHFVDKPWYDQGGKAEDYPEFKINPTNLTLIIPEITMWLRGEEGYQNTTAYKAIMKHNLSLTPEEVHHQSESVGKSYALRLLIHYLGDVHQPLHCSSRVDKAFPEGDKGGNMFPLPNHFQSDDLHGVWDSVLYTYHGKYSLVSTPKSLYML